MRAERQEAVRQAAAKRDAISRARVDLRAAKERETTLAKKLRPAEREERAARASHQRAERTAERPPHRPPSGGSRGRGGPHEARRRPHEAEKRERRTHTYPSNGGRQAPRSGLLRRQSREARQSPNQPHEPLTRKAESHRSPKSGAFTNFAPPPSIVPREIFRACRRLSPRPRATVGRARVGEGAVSPGRSEGLLRPGNRFPLGSCRWRCGSRRRSTPSRSYCQ